MQGVPKYIVNEPMDRVQMGDQGLNRRNFGRMLGFSDPGVSPVWPKARVQCAPEPILRPPSLTVMNRRLLKLLTLWMLPLLVARAIVPVGFMFMAHADGLRLMFCPSVVQTLDSGSQAHDHAAHFARSGEHDAGMHALHTGQHASGEPGSNDAGHDKTPCPFSLVASAALVDVPYVAIHAALIADRFRFFQTLPARTVDPSFEHHIRGPPSFS